MEDLYSNAKREMTIEEGCPWYEAQQEYGAANVNWCEPTRCSIINEPANSWSNFGYIFAAIIILVKINQMKEVVIKHFAWAVIAMGTFSFTYHATNNYFSQFFDFIGMFLMTSLVIAFNVQRVRGKDPRNLYAQYWFIFSMNVIIFMCFDFNNRPIQQIVMLNVIPLIVLDLIAGYKEGILKKYTWFGLGALSLLVAQIVSQLDLKRIYCEPDNLFLHGHAMWHVIGGLGMVFLGMHMVMVLKERK
ncbi:MAG: putative membrane channel-forming protein YqfA (hemolysin III family) [Thermoproteota archaeon]|jgi:predicted membrane channel-forming protein YqfA (hemolysin III family)